MDTNNEREEELTLATFASKVANEFSIVDKRFNGVKNKINSVDEKINDLDMKVNYLIEIISKLNFK